MGSKYVFGIGGLLLGGLIAWIIISFSKNYKYPVNAPKYRKIKMQDGSMKCFNFHPSKVKEDYGVYIEEANSQLCQ